MVPYRRETTILGTRPISGDFVLSANRIHEVVGVLFSFVFDAKVVNDKSESCGAPSVHEQTSGVLGLVVSWGRKVLREALFVKNSVLGNSIHALSNFNNDMFIVNKRGKILFFHYGVRDLLERDAHVFIMVKGCAKIDFFEIVSHESGTGCRDCSVEESFYGDKIHSFSAEISELVDEIATNNPSDALFLYF